MINHSLGYYSTPCVHSLFSKLFIIIFPCATGVPGRPEITGFTKPATEGEVITLTCTTTGSKPAANIRWFRNDKEVQGKHVVCASQSTVYPLLPLVSYWRHHYCQVFQLLHSFPAHIHALFHCPGFSGAMIRLAHRHCCCCCWEPSRYCCTVPELSKFRYLSKPKTYSTGEPLIGSNYKVYVTDKFYTPFSSHS